MVFVSICVGTNISEAQNKTIQKITKSNNNSNFTKLFDFGGTNSGAYPDEIIKSGNVLYGTAGKLYKINTDGSGFTDFKVNKDYMGVDNFTILDTMLLGIRYDMYGYGYVYSISVNGIDLKDIHSFTDENQPQFKITASGNYIYGVQYGEFWQNNPFSYLFKLKPDGTAFEEYQSVGDMPRGGLIIEDNYIYGTTMGPPRAYTENNFGTVYRIKTDGTDFKELHRFTDTETGDGPTSLTALGDVLYGSTSGGGINDYGVVFKINKDGSNFKILHHFSDDEGYGSKSKLVFSGYSFYGTARWGGSSDYGTIFKINPDGSGFQKLYDFQGEDGDWPIDLTISNDTIFGITRRGGINNKGTIFRYIIDMPSVLPIEPPKVFTLSIIKPEKINLVTKKGIVIDIGSYIDLDTTFSVEGSIPYTHSWNVLSGNDFVEIDKKVSINQNNTFYLFVVTTQGCTFTDSVTVQAKNVSSIEGRFASENQIFVYPNPNQGIFQIEILDGNADYEYDIFDISGRKIANGTIHCQTNSCIQDIEIDNVRQGTYNLVVRIDDTFYCQKKLIIKSQ